MRRLIISTNSFLLLIASVLTCGLEQSHFKSSCGNEKATSKTGLADDGYCESSGEDYNPPKLNCMRAAVVDYSRIDGRDCKSISQANLDAYEGIIELAKKDGASMIVFPEDGIVMCSESCMSSCLEEIPDPINLADGYNPCLQPDRFDQDFPILIRLSCLAKKYGIYLIANYGTKEKRANSSDTNNIQVDSPKGRKNSKRNGEYMLLNTDVIFEPSGRFIRRYRKWNPFTETEIFEKAPRLEHVYFDTDYGRFGIFTCFDMLFREPAIDLVESYHIDTALFPTWWFDELPLLTAVQFQDGWSTRNDVNLLAANVLKPDRGSLGSSIFSGNNSVYVNPEEYNSKEQVRKTKILLGTIQTSKSGELCQQSFSSKIIEFDTNANFDNYRHKNYKLHDSDTLQVLDNLSGGQQTVCSGKLCCRVDYKLTNQSVSDVTSSVIEPGKIAIFVRDGPRPGFYQWYEQVCALATIKKSCNSCDAEQLLKSLEFDEDAAVGFDELSIEAIFDTSYVYPVSGHSLSKLVNRNERKFHCNQMTSKPGRFDCKLEYVASDTNVEANKLYSFGLYGRVYERDMKH